jgi:hypothetical protein
MPALAALGTFSSMATGWFGRMGCDMQRRKLRFDNYEQALNDVEHLLTVGYQRLGNWSLPQICNHLAVVMEKSLDGFPSLLPWPLRLIARRFYLNKVMRHEVFHRRAPAAAGLLPPDSEDAPAALARLRSAIGRLNTHSGPMAASPAFGPLLPSQWREVHLWHCEHHLSFLVPARD